MQIHKPLSDAIDAIPDLEPDHPLDSGSVFVHARREDPTGDDVVVLAEAIERARAAACASLAADGFDPDWIRCATQSSDIEGSPLLDGAGQEVEA